jgi:hypothetical protein
MQFLRLRVRVKSSCVCDESAVTCARCDGMPVKRRLPRDAYNYINARARESELEKNAFAPEQPQHSPANSTAQSE